MTGPLRRRGLVLIGVNLILVAAGLFLWRKGEERVRGIDTFPITAVSVPTLVLRGPEPHGGLYAAIQDAPLFHSTRFYIAPPPPTVEPVEPPFPSYTFAGAMVLPGSKSFAALRDPISGQTLRVGIGDPVSGWRVQTIEAHRVILAFADSRREIGAGPPSGGAAGLKAVTLSAVTPASASASPKVLGDGTLTASRGITGGAGTEAPRLYRPPPR